MFILARGNVAVCSKDGTIVYKHLEEGSFFGEIALVTEASRRTASIRATTYCDLDILRKEDFMYILQKHPHEIENIGFVQTAHKKQQAMQVWGRRVAGAWSCTWR